MIKRLLCLLVAIALLVSVTACSNKPPEALKQDANDDNKFEQYSPDYKSPSDVEIPSNYIETSNGIYAVLGKNNEVTGYKRLIQDANNEYSFVDCDSDGNVLTTTTTTTVPPTASTTKKDTPDIKFEETTFRIKVGQTQKMEFYVDNEEYTPKDIVWESSNSNIATVKDGKITGVKEGTCQITVTIDGAKTVCNIIVEGKNATTTSTTKKPTTTTKKTTTTIVPSSVSLNKSSATLKVGDTLTLTASISPSNASNQRITWTSSNTAVATVSSGKVTAKGSGSAIITAKTSNNKTATCKITVNAKTIAPSAISLSSSTITLYAGENAVLSATISPTNATDKTITWSTSNSKVATVSGGKIVAKAAGTATITAKTSNGKTATCKVTVKDKVVPLQWTVVALDSCPTNVKNEFKKYTSQSTAKTLTIEDGGYVYVMIKVAKGKKVSITSVSESGSKIIVTTSSTSGSNAVYLRHNKTGYTVTIK